jgi:hypothetical protein
MSTPADLTQADNDSTPTDPTCLTSEEHGEETREEPAVLNGLTSAFIDPHGFFVYLLWDGKEDPFYVGASANIHRRIGMWVNHWGTTGLEKVQIVRCRDRNHMLAVEASLIKHYQPIMNTVHNK